MSVSLKPLTSTCPFISSQFLWLHTIWWFKFHVVVVRCQCGYKFIDRSYFFLAFVLFLFLFIFFKLLFVCFSFRLSVSFNFYIRCSWQVIDQSILCKTTLSQEKKDNNMSGEKGTASNALSTLFSRDNI